MTSDPAEPMKLSVVVPLYNEQDNVALVVDEVGEALAGAGLEFELVLVDDGSSDATVSRIPARPFVRVLEFEENRGQSAAMYTGLMAARGELLALLDGDLQNNPADIPAMVAELERAGADLVCGYRANRKDTAFKRFQSRVANSVRSRFTGDGVRDTGCTLKVMRRACREALFPFTGMHRFIPALVKGAGFSVVEFPVNHRARHAGASKYGGGLRRAIPATRDMFGVRWLLSRRFSVRLKDRGDGAHRD